MIEFADGAVRAIFKRRVDPVIVLQKRADVDVRVRIERHQLACHRIEPVIGNHIAGEGGAQILQIAGRHRFIRIVARVQPCRRRVVNRDQIACRVFQVGKTAAALRIGWQRVERTLGNAFARPLIRIGTSFQQIVMMKNRSLERIAACKYGRCKQ